MRIFLGIIVLVSLSISEEVKLSTGKVSAGDVLVIKVLASKEVRIGIGKSLFPTYPADGEKARRVIIGVPSWWDEGTYEVLVNGRNSGKSFEVVRKEFPEQKIKIAPEKVVENEETRKQRELMYKSIATLSSKKLWKGRFIMPVGGLISTEFGMRRVVNNETRGYHKGIDISADIGTEIKAPNSGKVVMTGNYLLPGRFIIIDHGQGIVSTFYHLSRILVKVVDFVKQRQIIGKVGATGMSTGAHLHWGMYVFSIDVNGMNFINNVYDN